MCSSASSTDAPALRDGRARTVRSCLEKAIARVLVVSFVALSPASGRAGGELPEADQLRLETAGSVDNSQAGLTVIDSLEDQGRGVWEAGLDQPADNTLRFDQPSADSSFLNIVDGEFGAHLNGTVISNGTVAFSSPFGVFIGGEAILDVGGLVAVGSDLSDPARFDADFGRLDLEGDVSIAAGAEIDLVAAGGDVLLYGRNVSNAGSIRLGTGELLMLAGDSIRFDDADSIADALIEPEGLSAILRGGTVTNTGRIEAGDARLLGGRVMNQGEIRVRDGALMMLGGDAVYLREIDNPVLLRLPHTPEPGTTPAEDPDYAVENHGQLDAGLGHVRLAAADPLGWGVRQGSGSTATPARVAGGRIELDAGEDGRIQLAGEVDARDRGDALAGETTGGQIDVTGTLVALTDATLDASGAAAGGTIQIGGEQQGRGELQRARAVVVDEDSTVRADATREGDGGRVIVFAEDLASIRGTLSAAGGAQGGDGGFVETSGLRHLDLGTSPDVSAPSGDGGDWLIDPYSIEIVDTPPDDPENPGSPDPLFNCEPGASCLNRALSAIVSPGFDSVAFDDILRTSGTTDGSQGALPNNQVSVDLLKRALSAGISVTLSTEVFNETVADPPEGPGITNAEALAGGPLSNGDIRVATNLVFDNAELLPGTRASLTLLAAGSIYVNGEIRSGEPAGGSSEPANLALSLAFRANDVSQRPATAGYGDDLLRGSVYLNANINTGGGSLDASGISVEQAGGTTIETRGGDVRFTSGSIGPDQSPVVFGRDDGPLFTAGNDPGILIGDGVSGTASIDTTRFASDPGEGGDILLTGNGIRVQTFDGPNNFIETENGILDVADAMLTSDGGDIQLLSGTTFNDFAGEVRITNAMVDAARTSRTSGELLGGDVAIDAQRVTGGLLADPDDPDDPDKSGRIGISSSTAITTGGGRLTVGTAETRTVSIAGSSLDTRQSPGPAGDPIVLSVDDENGLLAIVALDVAGVDAANGRFGEGTIDLDATSLDSSGITLEGRTITTADSALTLRGDSSATLFQSVLGVDSDPANPEDLPLVEPGELLLRSDRLIELGANTALSGDSIRILAGLAPTELNEDELDVAGDPALERRLRTRLIFGGTGGNTAADGVRLSARDITLQVGDGPTASENLDPPEEGLGTPAEPTSFALSRETTADYNGLQLRDQDGTPRPEVLSIQQDGDLRIVATNPTSDGELHLGNRSGTGGTVGAFGSAAIGDAGLRTTLESSDGRLVVDTAAGLNRTAPLPGPGDEGRSWARLNGGLLLNPSEGVPPTESAIQISTVLTGVDAFDLDALTLSTPRDLRITQSSADTVNVDSLQSVDELLFEAGRNTEIFGAIIEGSIDFDPGVTAISANSSLGFHAARSGFGDLVFDPAQTITLQADEIALRAGGGAQSQNDGTQPSPEVQGAQGALQLRNAAGGDFLGASPSDRARFTFRQDAAIDASDDLPAIAQFSTVANPAFSFLNRTRYAVLSDGGTIDLLGDDGSQFREAALALTGLQPEDASPVLVDPTGFDFGGAELEIGATGNFQVSAALAGALGFDGNSPNAQGYDLLKVRAGGNQGGSIAFVDPVQLRAGHIELIAGDGPGGTTGSLIDLNNVSFDLSDAPDGDRTFVLQEEFGYSGPASFVNRDQFSSGGLPNVLAFRSDGGIIDLVDFEYAVLPLEIGTGMSGEAAARFILEAREIQLTSPSGDDLALTGDGALSNVRLRIRSDELALDASTLEALTGRVLIGPRSGDNTTPVAGPIMDGDLDDESLLIEAFDENDDSVTLSNLSDVSQAPNDPTMKSLEAGLGPALISIRQAESITPDELPNRAAVSGYFLRSGDDEPIGDPIATQLALASTNGGATLEASRLEGSALLVGNDTLPIAGDVRFLSEAEEVPLDDLFARSEGSIFVESGVQLRARNRIQLEAAQIGTAPDVALDPSNPMGNLVFESGAGTTTLSAREITLLAGPEAIITNPDADGDGARDLIEETDPMMPFLARVDLSGLTSLSPFEEEPPAAAPLPPFDNDESLLSIRQTAALDLASTELVGLLDDGLVWQNLAFASTQGSLTVRELSGGAAFSSVTEGLSLVQSFTTDPVVFETDLDAPLAGFQGPVRIEGDDITIRDIGADGTLQLDDLNLQLVGFDAQPFFFSADDQGRLRALQDESVRRPILRVEQQAGDFTDVVLPRADRYRRLEVDFFGQVEEVVRTDLSEIDLELNATGPLLFFNDTLRDGASFSNLILRAAGTIQFDLDDFTPGFDAIDGTTLELDPTDSTFAALQLTSLDLDPGLAGRIEIEPFDLPPLDPMARPPELSIETSGDQRFGGDLVLRETLTTIGRGLDFLGDIFRDAVTSEPDAGLIVGSTSRVDFDADIGLSNASPADGAALGSFYVVFDRRSDRTPTVQFGPLRDSSGADLDQTVRVDGNIGFLTTPLTQLDDPTNPNDENRLDDLRTAIETATSIQEIDAALQNFDTGRRTLALYATIGKGVGSLTFEGAVGTDDHFIMGSGERLSVGGDLIVDRGDGAVVLGDVSALEISVVAREIGLLRRNAGVTFNAFGASSKDGGSVILANTIDLGGVTPQDIGIGKRPRFALQNPYDPALPAAFDAFPLFAATASGLPIEASDFFFRIGSPDGVPALLPTGASRSELTGAYGPLVVPIPSVGTRLPAPPSDPARLRELDVEARETPARIQIARVQGAAIIDDLGLAPVDGRATVTDSRLDAEDAEAAIALHESLFGAEGERRAEVRAVLQGALDDYLETTRARRVIGFELRRFVKNRPSTLLEAYQTLDDLDALFRYHRRLGLSPGEFRHIQRGWLTDIKPDGITIEELSEAIHPSRYVRGSDILDIFGR